MQLLDIGISDPPQFVPQVVCREPICIVAATARAFEMLVNCQLKGVVCVVRYLLNILEINCLRKEQS